MILIGSVSSFLYISALEVEGALHSDMIDEIPINAFLFCFLGPTCVFIKRGDIQWILGKCHLEWPGLFQRR